MFKVKGQTEYVLDHDVPAWRLDWDNRVKQELKIIIPSGTRVDIVDEPWDERGRGVCFIALEPNEHLGSDQEWVADADDFWGVEEVLG